MENVSVTVVSNPVNGEKYIKFLSKYREINGDDSCHGAMKLHVPLYSIIGSDNGLAQAIYLNGRIAWIIPYIMQYYNLYQT